MKKSYLVTFAPCARVVVEENATEEEITEAARRKMCSDPEQYITGDNCTYCEEDTAMPYGPGNDDKEVDQPILFHPCDIENEKEPINSPSFPENIAGIVGRNQNGQIPTEGESAEIKQYIRQIYNHVTPVNEANLSYLRYEFPIEYAEVESEITSELTEKYPNGL